MREVGAPSTWGEVVGCPVRSVPGAPRQSWSHRLRSRATRRGRKAKAAPQEGYPVSAARDSIKAGVLHLASLQRGNLILARIATTLLHERLPWVTTSLYPTASEREECMLALCSSGYSQRWRWLEPWRLIGGCTYWSAAGFSSEVRAGVDPLKTSPARQWRAMGRIEHTLFDRGRSSTPSDLRPSPATPPIPHKVTDVSIYDRGPEPRRVPAFSGHLCDYRSIARLARAWRRYPPACPSCLG